MSLSCFLHTSPALHQIRPLGSETDPSSGTAVESSTCPHQVVGCLSRSALWDQDPGSACLRRGGVSKGGSRSRQTEGETDLGPACLLGA